MIALARVVVPPTLVPVVDDDGGRVEAQLRMGIARVDVEIGGCTSSGKEGPREDRSGCERRFAATGEQMRGRVAPGETSLTMRAVRAELETVML